MARTLRDNPVALILAAVTVLVALSLFLLSGCNLAHYIQVDVPTGVQVRLGVLPKIPLDEASDVFQQLIMVSRQDQQRFSENIQRGWDTFGFLSMAANIGLSAANASGLAAIPGGSILLTLLAAGAGLALNKPGTARRVAKEKEKSFNKGLFEGRNGGS